MSLIKTQKQIEGIKKAAAVWKKIKNKVITEFDLFNKTTKEIDEFVGSLIINEGATPTFKNYHGFTGNICISINEEVIHGVPGSRKVTFSDLVTIDMGITLNGYIVDAAFTIEMPNVSEEFKKINKITYESLIEAIKKVKSGIKVSEIGKTIQQYVEKNGYCVLRDFSGHGCGLSLHEQPYIYNYETSTDEVLEENMIVCIEPMVTTNSIDYKISSNMWTISSKNNLVTCHWEHMLLVTKDGCEVLTE